jgi:hypothetical protein
MTTPILDAVDKLKASLVGEAEPPAPEEQPKTVEQRLTRVERDLAAIYGRLNRLLVIVTAALLSEWAKVLL